MCYPSSKRDISQKEAPLNQTGGLHQSAWNKFRGSQNPDIPGISKILPFELPGSAVPDQKLTSGYRKERISLTGLKKKELSLMTIK